MQTKKFNLSVLQYIHGLHDILTSDMSHLGHNLGNKTRVDFEFKRLNYEADEEIRSLPRSRRTCLFHSETISKYFDVIFLIYSEIFSKIVFYFDIQRFIHGIYVKWNVE